MGDKGGRKDKAKNRKQKDSKKKTAAKNKKAKLPKSKENDGLKLLTR